MLADVVRSVVWLCSLPRCIPLLQGLLLAAALCSWTGGSGAARQEESGLCHSLVSCLASSCVAEEHVFPYVLCHICQSSMDVFVVSEVILGP